MNEPTQEIALQKMDSSQELILQQDRNNFELAKMSMQATSESNRLLDSHLRTSRRDHMIFAAAILLLILGFCIVAMFLGKEQIALEVVKAGIFISAGGGAGYAFGTKKNSPPKNNP